MVSSFTKESVQLLGKHMFLVFVQFAFFSLLVIILFGYAGVSELLNSAWYTEINKQEASL